MPKYGPAVCARVGGIGPLEPGEQRVLLDLMRRIVSAADGFRAPDEIS